MCGNVHLMCLLNLLNMTWPYLLDFLSPSLLFPFLLPQSRINSLQTSIWIYLLVMTLTIQKQWKNDLRLVLLRLWLSRRGCGGVYVPIIRGYKTNKKRTRYINMSFKRWDDFEDMFHMYM